MKAWRIYSAGDIRKEELASQPVGENCVKIKILKAAVTHTDNLIYEGLIGASLPVVPGRHCVAMVSEVGEQVKNVVRGCKVTVSPFTSCHNCAECNQGRSESCEHKLDYGRDEDGFLRDFAVVHSSDLYRLPERVDDKEAMFLEHIATAIGITSKLGLQKGEHIAIIGATVTGIILAQVAIYYQAVPVLIDLRRDRLDMAASLGVYYTVDTTECDAFKKVFSLTGGRMAETCAYMAPDILPPTRAFDFCATRGRVALCCSDGKGLNADMNALTSKQLSVFGVSGIGRNMQSAINMLANKSVSVAPLVSREIDFSSVGDTFKEMAQLPDKYVKIIVDTTK